MIVHLCPASYLQCVLLHLLLPPVTPALLLLVLLQPMLPPVPSALLLLVLLHPLLPPLPSALLLLLHIPIILFGVRTNISLAKYVTIKVLVIPKTSIIKPVNILVVKIQSIKSLSWPPS